MARVGIGVASVDIGFALSFGQRFIFLLEEKVKVEERTISALTGASRRDAEVHRHEWREWWIREGVLLFLHAADY